MSMLTHVKRKIQYLKIMKKFNFLIIVTTVLIFGVVRSAHVRKSHHNKNANSKSQRIVGGKEVSIADHPYMANIMIKAGSLPEINDNEHLCGCVIISPNWVVTAGHCYWLILEDYGITRNDIYIHSNTADYTTGNQRDVIKWACHNQFNINTLKNDIAMMMVENPFTGEYEKPIAVASKKYGYKENRLLMVTGWGLEHQDDRLGPQKLRGVEVGILDFKECQKMYHDNTYINASFDLYDTMFCAGFSDGVKDACTMDSGGPIFDQNLLVGVVSFGYGCAQRRRPGVYTRLGKFNNWMVSTPKNLNSPAKIVFKDD